MLKKLSVVALVGAFSLPLAAMAQDANEPPKAPTPSEAGASGGSMSKDSMSKNSMSKSSHKHMKKKHKKSM